MILIDTNVTSEASRPGGHPNVTAWLDRQAIETLYVSAVTVAELLQGIAILPEGRRKRALDASLRDHVLPVFAGRILPFDLAAAEAYAHLRAQGRASGKAIGTVDGYIAAIALARGLSVATRDTSPLAAAGVPIINPWSS